MARLPQYVFSEAEDTYIKKHYLTTTRREIAAHLKLGYNLVKSRMDKLGLEIPKEVVNRFKGTHKSVKDQKPKPEKKVKAKKTTVRGSRSKVDKPEEVKFKNKAVDYSKLEMYKVDARTWKYRPKKSA